MTQTVQVTNFQAVRWVAASLVVASHIYLEASRLGVDVAVLSNASTFADLGVALFFVLSGWLMSMQMLRPNNRVMNFLGRRLVRIVPLYALVTLAVVAFQLFISRNIEPVHWALSFLFLSQALGFGHPALYVGWTLEYEMFFYLLVGATLLLRNLKLRLASALAILLLLSAVGALPPVVVFFAWGILSHLAQRLTLNLSKLAAALLAAALGSLLVIQVWSGLQVYGNVLVLGFEIAILFNCLAATWQVKSRWVDILGDASYAQYLVHVPVLTVLAAALANKVNEFTFIAICFSAITAVSVASWFIFDRPMGRFGRSLISGS